MRPLTYVRPFVLILPMLAAPAGAQCPDADPLRNAYFGDLHVHTAYSFDSILVGVVAGPRDAYDFARGAPLALTPYDLGQTAQIRRPLDFAAATDHAEFFGEEQVCTHPEFAGYDSSLCQDYRGLATSSLDSSTINPGNGILVFLNFALPLLDPAPERSESVCGVDAVDCLPQASLVWDDIQAAAEEKNDPCSFSTFHGWEWTANSSPSAPPEGAGLHRNVLFRSDAVTAEPISYFDEPQVEGLWDRLVTECIDADPDCDAITIPHNPNFSSGLMFAPFNSDDGTPLSAEDAAFRASMEPVVEMSQHKGQSECKPGVLDNDELCAFESLDRVAPIDPRDPNGTFPPLSYVRNGLKEGLAQEQLLGVNPFQLGMIGSTDGHNALAGATFEADYGVTGHQGANDWSDERILNVQNASGIEGNGGGLAVVWAEENTRGSLFDAIRRREVYATSGTRPLVRTFAGNLPKKLCDDPDFVARGYQRGVPMGGEIGAVRGGGSPRFAVMAMQDSGPPGVPGTPLQRIQMVKGWVDAGGTAHERVYEIAGDPDNGATVDLDTCEPQGDGFATLCTVWRDPDFDPEQRAFYYARILENPTCRWSRALCNSLSVDCNDPGPLGLCCTDEFPKTIQERAWTSPVFYRPEAPGRVRGKIKFGSEPGRDVLDLKLRAHRFAGGFDPATDELSIELRDDGVVYSATLPAGTLEPKGSGYSYRSSAGQISGLRFVSLRTTGGRLRLRVKTRPIDLSAAEAADHEVELRVALGTNVLTHRRRWTFSSGQLQTR